MNAFTPKPFADEQAAYAFVVAQGRNIETAIYQKRYPNYDYASHVPVVTEGNPWAIGTTFQTIDVTGEAKFISGSANDIPFNSATRGQASHDFAMIGAGWDWTDEEVAQSQLYGIPLSNIKAMEAANSTERLLYNIAMTGSTEKNWTGFVNDSSVPRADVANDGTSSSTFWSAKTPLQIMRDIYAGFSSVKRVTAEVEQANAIRLPPAAMEYIAQTYTGTDGTSPTILERLKTSYQAQFGTPLDIAPMRALATASSDGGGRMVIYRKDPEVVRFHLPMPRRVIPPLRTQLMKYQQGVFARTGGVEIRLPKAMTYLDEITDIPS